MINLCSLSFSIFPLWPSLFTFKYISVTFLSSFRTFTIKFNQLKLLFLIPGILRKKGFAFQNGQMSWMGSQLCYYFCWLGKEGSVKFGSLHVSFFQSDFQLSTHCCYLYFNFLNKNPHKTSSAF